MLSARAVLGALAVSVGLSVSATPAHAAVWGCRPSVGYTYNTASTYCTGGFGSYRVVATCNSPSWPYTKTVYGPWRYRSSGMAASPVSYVRGDSHGCHFTKAWTGV